MKYQHTEEMAILKYLIDSNNTETKELILLNLKNEYFQNNEHAYLLKILKKNRDINIDELKVIVTNTNQIDKIGESIKIINEVDRLNIKSEKLILEETEKFIKRALLTEALANLAGTIENEEFTNQNYTNELQRIEDFTLLKKESEIINLTEVMKTKLEDYKWHCESFLPVVEGKLTMVSGRGASGKGIAMIRNALLYLEENPTKKALLWNMEDNLQDISLRISTLKENGLKISDSVMSRLDILNTTDYISYNQLKAKFKNHDYVVVDPMSHILQGDENDSSTVKPIMIYFNNICKEENKIIILVHHEAKGTDGKGKGEGRGSSSFFDNVRLSYSLSYEDGLYHVVTAKNNYGENREEFSLDVWHIETQQTIGAELNSELNSNKSDDVLDSYFEEVA